MKKVFAVAALSVFALASCKKDYTCECTFEGNGISGSVSATITDTKKKAKEACEEDNGTVNGVTTTCEIK